MKTILILLCFTLLATSNNAVVLPTGLCSNGVLMDCFDSSSFVYCSNGASSPIMKCGPSTECIKDSVNKAVYCDYAQPKSSYSMAISGSVLVTSIAPIIGKSF